MKKIKVRLKCQLDDGEQVFPPESEMEMERDEAMALAGMGMLEIIPQKNAPKPRKSGVPARAAAKAKTKAAGKKNDNPDDFPDDSDDQEIGLPDPDSLVE